MSEYQDYWDELRQKKEEAKKKANEVVNALELPKDNTYIWHIKRSDCEGKAGGSYGSSKSGLMNSLRGWFDGASQWNTFEVTVKICPLEEFEVIYKEHLK